MNVKIRSTATARMSAEASHATALCLTREDRTGLLETCVLMVESGIDAILNFAPILLRVPPNVYVRNVSFLQELAVLSYHLSNEVECQDDELAVLASSNGNSDQSHAHSRDSSSLKDLQNTATEALKSERSR